MRYFILIGGNFRQYLTLVIDQKTFPSIKQLRRVLRENLEDKEGEQEPVIYSITEVSKEDVEQFKGEDIELTNPTG